MTPAGVPRCVLAGMLGSLLVPPATWGQTPQTDPRSPAGAVWRALSDSSRASWLQPVASLLVPGTGQLLRGSEHGALYLVAEVFLVARFFSLQHDAREEADRYRDVAFSVARSAFTPQTRDTVWGYYEAMGEYTESGPFNESAGPDLVPPTDVRTFNGHIWQLARQTYFANPDSTPDASSTQYQAALALYRRRAVGPDFRWSWRGAAIEQDLYRQTIHSSDEAYRQARQQLGLLLANHLLSAVDALVSNRLSQRHGRAHLSGHVQLGPSARGLTPRFTLHLRATF